MTIAYLTDLHLDEDNTVQLGADGRRNWLLIYQDLIKRNVDMVVFGGDIGEGEGVPWLFNFMQGFEWHITPGNHDAGSIIRAYYQNYEVDGRHAIYFGFDKLGYRYIFLDTSANELDAVQLAWLEKHVDTDLPLIVFIHHPVLPVSTWVDYNYPLKNRAEVERILHKHIGKVTIFCGHYHLDHEQQADNITQYICPAVSFQICIHQESFLPDISYTAYHLIHISEEGVQREVIKFAL